MIGFRDLNSFYFSSVQELLTIATCEMKEEETRSKVLFWEMLNQTMKHCGYPPVDFHGFMADEARANWCAISIMFNGGPTKIMEDREHHAYFIGNKICLNILSNV